MSREEMVEALCEMYEKNGVSYSLKEVQTFSEDQLKDEMAEYADI